MGAVLLKQINGELFLQSSLLSTHSKPQQSLPRSRAFPAPFPPSLSNPNRASFTACDRICRSINQSEKSKWYESLFSVSPSPVFSDSVYISQSLLLVWWWEAFPWNRHLDFLSLYFHFLDISFAMVHAQKRKKKAH